jgi:YD repeat-containing protein
MPGLIRDFDYNAEGNMTKAESADGSTTTWGWHPERQWLTGIVVESADIGLLSINFDPREPNGLVIAACRRRLQRSSIRLTHSEPCHHSI